MFVGHGLAAFAIVALAARWRGVEPRRALQVATVAALFATLPDVDILYGPLGLLNGVSGVFDAADAFWETGNVVHRGPTHSMVLGAFGALGFTLWARQTTLDRVLAATVLVGIVAVAAVVSGSIGAAVTALLVVGGLVIVRLAQRFELSDRSLFLATTVGLVSHPLGDLVTGTPPALLYPLDVTLVSERMTLATDPTIHLLGAFGIELAIIWLAVLTYAGLTDRRVRSRIDRTATLGVTYAGVALAMPAPTLETSYHFVFSVLAVGGLGVTRWNFLSRELREMDWLNAVATGLTAISLAAIAYLVAYVALSAS